jgi:hypothetical protein
VFHTKWRNLTFFSRFSWSQQRLNYVRIFWLLTVRDEGYSRNASFAVHLISTFLFVYVQMEVIVTSKLLMDRSNSPCVLHKYYIYLKLKFQFKLIFYCNFSCPTYFSLLLHSWLFLFNLSNFNFILSLFISNASYG